MPELPDVEGFRRVLATHGQGHRVTRVDVADPGVLREVTARRLARAVEGRRLAEPERRGKWLLMRTAPEAGSRHPDDAPTVLLHFGMTGGLVTAPPGEPAAAHDRVTFVLDDGTELRYRDQRKLRGLWLADTPDAVGRLLADQGPDALTLRRGELARALAERRRGRVKTVLLNQSVVAGLGNLLGDEILWRAHVHPERQTGQLSDDDRRRLDAATRRVLRDSVRAGHVPARRSWLTGRRYDDEPRCPRCGGPLSRNRVGGRTTAHCPHCQPA